MKWNLKGTLMQHCMETPRFACFIAGSVLVFFILGGLFFPPTSVGRCKCLSGEVRSCRDLSEMPPPSDHLPNSPALCLVDDDSKPHEGLCLYLILHYNPFNLGLYPVVFFMQGLCCQIKAVASGRRKIASNRGWKPWVSAGAFIRSINLSHKNCPGRCRGWQDPPALID